MAFRNPGNALAFPGNWEDLTPAQKRQYRLENLLKTEGIKFVNPEAEKTYRIRAKRLVDVYNVEQPDRVPVIIRIGNLPLKLTGVTSREAIYNVEKAIEATQKFNKQYSEELETWAAPFKTSPGNVLDLLDYKIYAWPGHGVSDDGGWQLGRWRRQ